MKYYSPEQIAEQYSLNPATVRKWLREGKLKAIKMGGLWRISEEALQEFIDQDRKEANQRMFNKWVEEGKKEG